MRKQIKLLFLTLILIISFSSFGFCIEPKYSWTIFVNDSVSEGFLYSLKFKEIYKNQDWMEYKIAKSGWVCVLRAISQGDNPKSKNDDGRPGIVEDVKVSCSRDNWRNVVYSSVVCNNSDYGKFLSVVNSNVGGLSFIHLNNKGERIYYHFSIWCSQKK